MLILLTIIACYMAFIINNARSTRRHLKALKRRNTGRYIYAYVDIGQLIPCVKIGRATTPENRLAAQRTAAPFGMWVVMIRRVNSATDAERFLHKKYAWLRISPQREWFLLTLPLLIDLLSLRDKHYRKYRKQRYA